MLPGEGDIVNKAAPTPDARARWTHQLRDQRNSLAALSLCDVEKNF